MKFKRKLYKRKHSIEFTLPKALLTHIDLKEKHCVVFEKSGEKWFINIMPLSYADKKLLKLRKSKKKGR